MEIVSVKLVRYASVPYASQQITSPVLATELFRGLLEDKDREHIMALFLDIKNQPTAINIISVGTLNSASVHP